MKPPRHKDVEEVVTALSRETPISPSLPSPNPPPPYRRDALGRDVQPLRVHHVLHAISHRLGAERGEAEPGASRLQGGDDLRHVVADEAEAGVLGVLLDDAPQRELRVFGHAVALVEDDEFETRGVEAHGACEGLHFVAHHVDPAV